MLLCVPFLLSNFYYGLLAESPPDISSAGSSRNYFNYLRQAYSAEPEVGAVNMLPGGGKSPPDAHSVASSEGSEMEGMKTGSVGSSRSNAMRELRERIQRERQQVMPFSFFLMHLRTLHTAVRFYVF